MNNIITLVGFPGGASGFSDPYSTLPGCVLSCIAPFTTLKSLLLPLLLWTCIRSASRQEPVEDQNIMTSSLSSIW